MIYSHYCHICKYKAEDTEFLKVCPDCSSNGITNDVPVGEISDDFIDEDDIKEDFDNEF